MFRRNYYIIQYQSEEIRKLKGIKSKPSSNAVSYDSNQVWKALANSKFKHSSIDVLKTSDGTYPNRYLYQMVHNFFDVAINSLHLTLSLLGVPLSTNRFCLKGGQNTKGLVHRNGHVGQFHLKQTVCHKSHKLRIERKNIENIFQLKTFFKNDLQSR